MSLILDALKKAEQDRHAGQAPVLDELLVRHQPAPPRRRDPQQDVLILSAVIFAVLFAVSGVVYWLWPSKPAVAATAPAAPASPAAAAVATAAEMQDQTPAAAQRVDPERLEAPVTDLPEDAVQTADTGATQASTMDELDAETPPAPQRAPTKPTAAVAAVPASAPPVASPAPAVEPGSAVTETAATPTQAVPPAPPAVAEPAVRNLKEMPPGFRSEFPKLTVDVHVYDANPLRRFVLINGKKYRETDTLLDGPRVVEITPVGLVLEHRGSKVLLELPR